MLMSCNCVYWLLPLVLIAKTRATDFNSTRSSKSTVTELKTTPKVGTTVARGTKDILCIQNLTTPVPITSTQKQVCKLARPKTAPEIYFFGARSERNSFIRYSVDGDVYKERANYVFLFYTLVKNGLLLNTLTAGKYDYESVYLKDGFLCYLFNAGSGYLLLKSKTVLNDGKWHTVQAIRDEKAGKLVIDGELQAEGQSPGGSKYINRLRKVYLGGMPSGVTLPALIPPNKRFVGGMGVITPPGKDNLTPPDAMENITPGFVSGLTRGVSIGEGGGYFQTRAFGEIGKDFTLKMTVRSSKRGGLLFYAKRVFSNYADGLQIIIGKEGEIIASCDNGGGEFTVTVQPEKDICDGEFHRIFLRKVSTTLFLAVDDKMGSVQSKLPQTSANTQGEPFYFGGIPDIIQPKEYVNFSGCISNIVVGDQVVKETDLMASGHAIYGCAKV